MANLPWLMLGIMCSFRSCLISVQCAGLSHHSLPAASRHRTPCRPSRTRMCHGVPRMHTQSDDGPAAAHPTPPLSLQRRSSRAHGVMGSLGCAGFPRSKFQVRALAPGEGPRESQDPNSTSRPWLQPKGAGFPKSKFQVRALAPGEGPRDSQDPNSKSGPWLQPRARDSQNPNSKSGPWLQPRGPETPKIQIPSPGPGSNQGAPTVPRSKFHVPPLAPAKGSRDSQDPNSTSRPWLHLDGAPRVQSLKFQVPSWTRA